MDMEKKRAFLINLAFYCAIAAIIYVACKYGLSILAPFVIAFLVAYVLNRILRRICHGMKRGRKSVAVLMVVLFYGTIGTLIVMLGMRAFSGVHSLVVNLPSLYTSYLEPRLVAIFAAIEELVMDMGISVDWLYGEAAKIVDSLGDMVTNLSMRAMALISGAATALPGLFIKLVILIISTFFFLLDYDAITGFCLNQLNGKSRELFHQIKEYTLGTLLVCIRSYLIIMSITCLELYIGFTIIKIDHALLLAAVIAVFDILPVLGTGGVLIPWIVASAILGSYSRSLGLLLLYIVVTVVRNIIEPKIVGKQLGLHPVVTLASMFAGVRILGGIGLFGFPIGLSLLRYLNDNGAMRLFKDEKAEKRP